MNNPLLARETDYAVRALCWLAARPHGTRVTVAAAARSLGMPHPFLRHILQVLSRAGIVASFKGRDGGFELTRPPAEITLGRLVEIFQGPLEITGCLFRKRICPDTARCCLRREILEIQAFAAERLRAVTIAGLVAGTAATREEERT